MNLSLDPLLSEVARPRRLVVKMDDLFRLMARNRRRFDSMSDKILGEIYAALQNEAAISNIGRDDES